MTSTIRQDFNDDHHYFDQHKVAVSSDDEKENNARDFINVVQHFH